MTLSRLTFPERERAPFSMHHRGRDDANKLPDKLNVSLMIHLVLWRPHAEDLSFIFYGLKSISLP